MKNICLSTLIANVFFNIPNEELDLMFKENEIEDKLLHCIMYENIPILNVMTILRNLDCFRDYDIFIQSKFFQNLKIDKIVGNIGALTSQGFVDNRQLYIICDYDTLIPLAVSSDARKIYDYIVTNERNYVLSSVPVLGKLC